MSIISVLLTIGSSGTVVEVLQGLLVKLGYELIVDGFFGEQTEEAVKEVQKKNNLKVDGIVGDQTANVIGLKTVPTNLKLSEHVTDEVNVSLPYLFNASEELGVEPELLRAFSLVESSGDGYLKDGRMKILFERHWMNRQLSATGIPTGDLIKVVPNIVNSKPGGYLGNALEYTRMMFAISIDEEIAYRSISMGRFQFMGFHYERLGFKSAFEMYNQLSFSNEAQFNALVKFIKTDVELHDSMVKKDFKTMAEIYNGPRHQQYDLKIKENYEKIKKDGLA